MSEILTHPAATMERLDRRRGRVGHAQAVLDQAVDSSAKTLFCREKIVWSARSERLRELAHSEIDGNETGWRQEVVPLEWSQCPGRMTRRGIAELADIVTRTYLR